MKRDREHSCVPVPFPIFFCSFFLPVCRFLSFTSVLILVLVLVLVGVGVGSLIWFKRRHAWNHLLTWVQIVIGFKIFQFPKHLNRSQFYSCNLLGSLWLHTTQSTIYSLWLFLRLPCLTSSSSSSYLSFFSSFYWILKFSFPSSIQQCYFKLI